MADRQTTEKQTLIRIARKTGVIRSCDLAGYGVSRTTLQRMVRDGEMHRVGRGVYRLPGGPVSAHATLVEVHRRVPEGVICLLSALAFHEIGTQSPSQVWVAIDRSAWKPVVPELPVRTVRFSGPALAEGVEHHSVEGARLPVYSPAKTVADCFKYRKKIGIDVAIEALRDGWRDRRFTLDELIEFAAICRVKRVIGPYIESLI